MSLQLLCMPRDTLSHHLRLRSTAFNSHIHVRDSTRTRVPVWKERLGLGSSVVAPVTEIGVDTSGTHLSSGRFQVVTFDSLFYFISYLKYALPTPLYFGEEVSPLRGYSKAISPSRLSCSQFIQANPTIPSPPITLRVSSGP
jgi:hypothetical protein